METQIKESSHETIEIWAKLINEGQLVAFPTETVYWLGADATNSIAVSKIFAVKWRPQDNPLIIHCWHKSDIEKYATINFELEKTIIKNLMPWPITIILPRKKIISDAVTAWQETVWVRIPDHISAIQLIRKAWVPLAAPSANASKKPSPTSASMVERDLKGKIPLIIDGGSCMLWIESTVIKVINEKEILILRPGFITKEDLEDWCDGDVQISYSSQHQEQSPWTRYTHYSPNGKVVLVDSLDNSLVHDLLEQWENIGLIATKEFLSANKTFINTITNSSEKSEPNKLQPITTFPRGSHTKLIECAQSLYNLYHKCDELNMSIILIEHLPEKWLWYAIMNRVKKSAQ